MSRNVRVSIVTPFLDAGRFIAEAIDSVLAQTRDCWELLLVDDGSTDGSTEIAHRYAAANRTRPGGCTAATCTRMAAASQSAIVGSGMRASSL